jgi:hypothetical protein
MIVTKTDPIARGKSTKNMAPAPPGRPFRTLFAGIKIVPEAPSRGRKKSLLKTNSLERKRAAVTPRLCHWT